QLLSRRTNDLTIAAGAGLLALVVAESLKFLIGRTPVFPDFLLTGTTGLHPFHQGNFPSATTAIVAAITTVSWQRRPRGRPLFTAIFLAAPLMLLITNSHWLSDVIAGGWLGAVLGGTALRVSLLRSSPTESP